MTVRSSEREREREKSFETMRRNVDERRAKMVNRERIVIKATP